MSKDFFAKLPNVPSFEVMSKDITCPKFRFLKVYLNS